MTKPERPVRIQQTTFFTKDGLIECAVEVEDRIRARGAHAHSLEPFNLDGIVVDIDIVKLHRILTVRDFDGVETKIVDEDIDFFEKLPRKK